MPRRRDWLRGGLALTAAPLAGCAAWPRPPVPMDLIHLDDSGPHAAPMLLVMLPGAYSLPGEFVSEGLVDDLRRRRLPVDVVIAGAGIDHYIEGPVLERLRDEVIAPARARGVQRVWLLGISLGGLFALGYAARHGAAVGGAVDGVLALAPYLGRRTLLAEIVRAGGPQAWAQGRVPQPDDLIEHEVWAWVARGGAGTGVHLGYGRDDRFADAHRLLAAQLPPQRHLDLPGGHDWPVWRALWQQWLDRGLLAGTPA